MAQSNKLGLGPVWGHWPVQGDDVAKAIYVKPIIWNKEKNGPRRNFSLDTESPERTYVQAIETHPLNTYKGRKHKISKQKLPPPHWMHYNYFPDRINVEKTPDQCYLGYHNSQMTERCVWWDGCSSGSLDDQQV